MGILKFIKDKHSNKDDDNDDDDDDDDDDDPTVIDGNCECKGKRKRSGRTLKTIYCFIKCKLHGKSKDEKPSDNDNEKPLDHNDNEKPSDHNDDNSDSSDNG